MAASQILFVLLCAVLCVHTKATWVRQYLVELFTCSQKGKDCFKDSDCCNGGPCLEYLMTCSHTERAQAQATHNNAVAQALPPANSILVGLCVSWSLVMSMLYQD